MFTQKCVLENIDLNCGNLIAIIRWAKARCALKHLNLSERQWSRSVHYQVGKSTMCIETPLPLRLLPLSIALSGGQKHDVH